MRDRILARSPARAATDRSDKDAAATAGVAGSAPRAAITAPLHQRRAESPRRDSTRLDTTTLRDLIKHGMPDAEVDVAGADGVHFEARVVSAAFAGKLPLARHRMVYATLGPRMGGEIHALALRTLTPEEAAQGA